MTVSGKESCGEGYSSMAEHLANKCKGLGSILSNRKNALSYRVAGEGMSCSVLVEVRDNLKWSLLSLHGVEPKDKTQVPRLGSNCLYPLAC